MFSPESSSDSSDSYLSFPPQSSHGPSRISNSRARNSEMLIDFLTAKCDQERHFTDDQFFHSTEVREYLIHDYYMRTGFVLANNDENIRKLFDSYSTLSNEPGPPSDEDNLPEFPNDNQEIISEKHVFPIPLIPRNITVKAQSNRIAVFHFHHEHRSSHDIESEHDETESQQELFQVQNNINMILSQPAPKHYKNYDDVIHDMKKDKTWELLSKIESNGLIAKIGRHYRVPKSTIHRWHKKLMKNPNWIGPHHRKDPNQAYAFTEAQEMKLEKMILSVTKSNKFPMNNHIFRQVALKYYYHLSDEEHPNPNLQFNCSNKWIKSFRKRHSLSRRRGHLKRRPAVTPEEIRKFREMMRKVLDENDHDHVVNCDETFWRAVEQSIYTWAKTGDEDV